MDHLKRLLSAYLSHDSYLYIFQYLQYKTLRLQKHHQLYQLLLNCLEQNLEPDRKQLGLDIKKNYQIDPPRQTF